MKKCNILKLLIISVFSYVVNSSVSLALPQNDSFPAKICIQNQRKSQVITPKKGLYEGISAPQKPIEFRGKNPADRLSISFADDSRMEISVENSEGLSVGHVTREVQGDHLDLIGSELDPGIPFMLQIPGQPELVDSVGIPPHLFMTFAILKRYGVRYGSLKSAGATIQNLITQFELAHIPKIKRFVSLNPGRPIPAHLFESHFMQTHSGRSINNIFVQSGHEVKSIKITPRNNQQGLFLDKQYYDPEMSLRDMYKARGLVSAKTSFQFKGVTYRNGVPAKEQLQPILNKTMEFLVKTKPNPIYREEFVKMLYLDKKSFATYAWLYERVSLLRDKINPKYLDYVNSFLNEILSTLYASTSPLPTIPVINDFDIHFELKPFGT